MYNRIYRCPLYACLVYSSLIGILQMMVVFMIFRYGFGFDLGDGYSLLLMVVVIYTLTIVALSMLMVGILQSPEQFNTLFPSIIPIMPLISGVYMPSGTITNPFR
ncbi:MULTISPECIES: ABC transporter permease [Paenibacillus]|nr:MULTISPECIES: ABC transporter permease [Paenibacillus]